MKKTALLLLLCMAVQGATCQQIRNLIYLIGDGMGLAHVSMLRIENGYEPTAFDRAQHVALISSQSANNRVTDSAAAGTALATGHKANNGSLGQLPDGTPVQSLVATAARRDFATGLAVTCYLQHATPAAFYAHTGRRGDLRHITRDMLASDIDVLLGGGRRPGLGGVGLVVHTIDECFALAAFLPFADGRCYSAVGKQHKLLDKFVGVF